MTVFLDMDGVTCDFVAGALKQHNIQFPIEGIEWNFPKQIGFLNNEAAFWAPLGRAFWAGLPKTPECDLFLRRLEEVVGADAICLLTSPCNTDGCIEGKLDWVKLNLPSRYRRQILVGSGKEFVASKGALLIDDHAENCHRFFVHGGQSILVPRPWNWRRNVCTPGGGFDVEALVEEVRAKREAMRWHHQPKT